MVLLTEFGTVTIASTVFPTILSVRSRAVLHFIIGCLEKVQTAVNVEDVATRADLERSTKTVAIRYRRTKISATNEARDRHAVGNKFPAISFVIGMQGVFFAAQFSAASITNMPALDLRQTQTRSTSGGRTDRSAPCALYWEILGLFIDGEIGRPV
jgi:hypothetical protein